MFHFRRSIKRPGSSLSDQLYRKLKRVSGRWCVGHSFFPSLRQGYRKNASEGAKESRVQRSCDCPSISTSVSNHTHTETKGGPLVESWLNVSQTPARRQGQVEGLPSRAGSWGFLGEVGECVWGCDAWAVCHSGWECGCYEGGHRGSERSRWPFHLVPAGRSLLALWQFGEEGGEKGWERHVRNKEVKDWQAQNEEKQKGEVHAVERQLTFPLINAYTVCTGSQHGTRPERP